MTSKVVSLREAVERLVPNGASVALGCALEPAIPFAFAHELIRQGRTDLHLIGPISDIAFDQLIGAGCVAQISAAWVGNVSAGLAHAYRRAMEEGVPRRIMVFDHSNFTIAQALLAGALGAPYLPTKTLLGSDILRSNPTLREGTDPFSGERVLLVPAITPDVAVIACQIADPDGNALLHGPWGVSQEAAMAARTVIVVAERVIARGVLARSSERLLAPSVKVTAVVEEPGGCHPSPLFGFYDRDHDFFHEYHGATRTLEGFGAWIAEWVTGVDDRAAYLKKLGPRWAPLDTRPLYPPMPGRSP
jgi:glutaconate CoA-transferase subunit A